jgi:hypothetical protein
MTEVEYRAALLGLGALMRPDFQTSALSGFKNRSGIIRKSFASNVITQSGDAVGLSFKAPRYAYILNHGVKSQSVKGRTSVYTTKGFSGNKFVSVVLDKHADKIASISEKFYGDQVESRIRF